MAEVIYVSNARLSFPRLVEAASPQPGAAPKFTTDLIFPPASDDVSRFMAEVGNVATNKWKEHAASVLQMLQNDRKLRCYGSGSEKIDKKTFKPYVGYEGNTYITASSNADHPPVIVRTDGTTIDNSNTLERQQAARKLYGGCYVNAVIRPWVQDNQFGRAIRCELIAIQFAKDGEAFGEGSVDVSSMFAPTSPGDSGLPSFMS